MRARTHTRIFFGKRDKKLDKCGIFVYIKIEEFYKRGTGFFIVPFFRKRSLRDRATLFVKRYIWLTITLSYPTQPAIFPNSFTRTISRLFPWTSLSTAKRTTRIPFPKKSFSTKCARAFFRPRRLSIRRPQSTSLRRILKKVRTCFSFAFRQNFRARSSRLRKQGKNLWKDTPTGKFAYLTASRLRAAKVCSFTTA